MARLIPVDKNEEEPKKLRLVPIEKKETSAKLVPVETAEPEREKIDQPLLKEANATSIKDVPEALLLAAKGMVVDFPLSIGGFIGGATYDAYDAILKGKYSLENARKSSEYMQLASQGAYNYVRGLIPVGNQQGAEQILNNIFTPLEKFATRGGEIVTDLTDSPVAGATTYATLQILPWVLGLKAAGQGIGVGKGVIEGVTQKNLAPRMTKLREAGLTEPVKFENVKQPILDTKAELIGVLASKAKALEEAAKVDPQLQKPETQKLVQEVKTVKEIHQSLGITNAGEIPEGKTIDLTLKKTKVYRGGEEPLDITQITDHGISVTTRKEIAKKGLAPDGEGYLSEAFIPKGVTILKENKIPKQLQDAYVEEHLKLMSDWRPAQEKIVKEKQKNIVDYARSEGYDLVEFKRFEKEIRVINPDVLKAEKVAPAPTSEAEGVLVITKKATVPSEQTQFTATNNIKEHQKSLIAAKEELVKTAKEDISKPASKGGRRNLIKERAEALKKEERLKEIDELSHYEETPDPLTVDTNKTVQDAFYKETETSAKAVTLQDISVIGKQKELGVNANIGANGDMIISVTDRFGNKADFPLVEGGVSLEDVHVFVKGWTKDFGASMKKEYEVKSEVIDNAAELTQKFTGKTKKHVTKDGEVIEYQTLGDLKLAYEQRGLPWKKSKKEYYKAKKIDEAAKAEIDDKLTPISQKSLPEIQLLDSQGNGKKPGILQWMEPFRFVAQDIEARTGFPIQQFESKIRDGSRQVGDSIVPYMKRLRDARSGINRESEIRIYRALENPSFRESNGSFDIFRKTVNADKELVRVLGGMTRTDYIAATKIRKILNDAAEEFNVPIDKMVLDYAPRMMREGVSGWTEAIEKWKLPVEYKWASLEERSGYMRPHEERIFKVVDSYIRRGATKRYVGDYLEELSKKLNETKFESKADRDQLKKYVATMRGWQTGFDESIRTTGETFARILNKAINAPFKAIGKDGSQRYRNVSYRKMEIEKKMINPETGEAEIVKLPRLIKESEEPGFFDVYNAANDFVNLHLKLSYAGALAWRPMVWARAMWQSTLALPITGPRSFLYGMKMATTPEGWHEAKAATALFAESPIAGGELSRGWTILDDITQLATWDTRSGHNIGRCVAYHAGKHKAERYGKSFLEDIKNGMEEGKAIQKYLDDSGADYFHPTLIKNEIVPLLKAKDITSLSERMGLNTTFETQWVYEKGQAPYWARSMAGRVMGQFGVWPSWYIKYVRNLSSRGSKKNIAKRLAGLGTINLITYEVGKEIFGVDVSGWTVSHPFMWFPLPVQTWDAARKLASGSDYEKARGKNALKNMAAMHVPGYLCAMSVLHGMEETRDEDKLKVMLGFKVAE
jgi:hypothetical protein